MVLERGSHEEYPELRRLSEGARKLIGRPFMEAFIRQILRHPLIVECEGYFQTGEFRSRDEFLEYVAHLDTGMRSLFREMECLSEELCVTMPLMQITEVMVGQTLPFGANTYRTDGRQEFFRHDILSGAAVQRLTEKSQSPVI